ncbi:unnamed protein product [Symbiodinium sp. CCMP2592]|nr:unnamed protein product [Symbiodinium sp. CCMP2592]
MEIWKQLIDTELKTAANWEGQWGFLKAEAGNPLLFDAKPSEGQGWEGESREEGTRARAKLDRSEALRQRKTLTPQERYSSMRITSHEIGWRPSIERFGVSHHGIKRDPGIWPDY